MSWTFGGAWPYASTPVMVATTHPLPDAPATVSPCQGEIMELCEQAKKAAGDKNVYLDGGNLVTQAIDADCVDELILTVIPVLLGQGVPLYQGKQLQRFNLELPGPARQDDADPVDEGRVARTLTEQTWDDQDERAVLVGVVTLCRCRHAPRTLVRTLRRICVGGEHGHRMHRAGTAVADAARGFGLGGKVAVWTRGKEGHAAGLPLVVAGVVACGLLLGAARASAVPDTRVQTRRSQLTGLNLTLRGLSADPAGPKPEDARGEVNDDPAAGPSEPKARTRRVVRNGAYLLYFYEHDPLDHESLLHILGLYWYRDTPSFRLHAAIPFGAYWQWKNTDRWGLVTPLYWQNKGESGTYRGAWLWQQWTSPEHRFSTLFPIYWNDWDRASGRDLTVIGPAYARSGPGGLDFGLLPVFWGSASNEAIAWTLAPLLHYDSDRARTRLISPVFFHSHDRETGEVRGGIPPLLSFWWSDADSSSFLQFPLVYKSRSGERELTLITPVLGSWSRRQTEASWLVPIYLGVNSGDQEFRLLLPLLYGRVSETKTDSSFTMLGPLYSWHKRRAAGWGLWPLISHEADSETEDFETLVAPLYYGHRNASQTTRVIPPLLFAQHASGDFAMTVLGTAYQVTDGSRHYRGLAPLYFHADDEATGDSFSMVPGLYLSDLTSTHQIEHWGPVYRHDTTEVSERGLFPLGAWRQHHDPGQLRELFVAPGLYWAGGRDVERFILGPYWRFRDHGTADDGLFPLFASHREKNGSHRLFAPGLIDVVDNDAEGRRNWRATWLLNGYRFAGRQSRTTLLAPLFVEHEDTASGDWWAAVAPWILANGNARRGERSILAFPYLEKMSEGERDWLLFPAAFGSSNPERSFWMAGPLLHYEGDSERGRAELKLIVPLFGRYTDGELEGLGTAEGAAGPSGVDVGWFGPYAWRLDRGSSFHLLAPLAFDYDNLETGSSLLAVLPLFFKWSEHTTAGDRSLHSLVPFYVHYREESSEGGGRSLTSVGPAFAYNGDTGDGFGLLPLFWHDRTKTESGKNRGHDILFPLLWSFFDEAHETESLVAGTFYRFSSPGRRSLGLAPLVFSADRQTEFGEEGYSALAPLFFHGYGFSDSGRSESLTLTPVGYDHRLGSDRRGFWGPYLYAREGDVQTDVVLPLFYSRRTSIEHSTLVLPAYWHHESPRETSTVVAPLYYHGEDHLDGTATTALLPYLGWSTPGSDVDMVLPLFFQQRDTDGRLFRLMLPGYLEIQDPARGTRLTALGPAWHRDDGTGGYDGGLFPLLWWGRLGGGPDEYALAFPLLWRSVADGGRDAWTIAATAWHHRHPHGWSAGLLPIGFAQVDRSEDAFRAGLLPFYTSHVGDRHTYAAVPLYFQTRTPTTELMVSPIFAHGADLVADLSWTWAGPLWSSRRGAAETSVLFPIYLNQIDGQGNAVRMLAPLYRATDGADGSWSRTLLPLFHRSESGDGQRSLTLSLPYIHSRSPRGETTAVPPLYLGVEWTDGAALSTVAAIYWRWQRKNGDRGAMLGPLYSTRDQDGSSMGLFPLAHRRSNNDGSTQGWLFPLAYHSESGDGQRVTTIAGPAFCRVDRAAGHTDFGLAPLFWGFDRPGASGSAVFPAYYYEGRDDGYTFVSPVALANRHGDTWHAWSMIYSGWGDEHGRTDTLFPLVYAHRGSDGSALDVALPLYTAYHDAAGTTGGRVAFPFYWNFYGPERDATVVFPLYWSFENKKRDVTVIVPWFMSRRRDRERVTHGLVPLYYYTEDPTGFTFNLLGGLVGVDHDTASRENDYQLMWVPF